MPVSSQAPSLLCVMHRSAAAAIARLESGDAERLAYMLAAIRMDLTLSSHHAFASSCTQAGTSVAGQAYIRSQLEVWQQSQWDSEALEQHIHKERLLIYQLLAGHVEDVIPSLDLDWRRALGLFFW